MPKRTPKVATEEVVKLVELVGDDLLFDVRDMAHRAMEKGMDEPPTLEQISAVQRASVALGELATMLLSHYRMADDQRRLESRLRAQTAVS